MRTYTNTALSLAEGNPGGLRICGELLRGGHTETLRAMERLGITGSRIWIVYKDLGNQTLERFIENVESADIVARLTELGYAPEPKG